MTAAILRRTGILVFLLLCFGVASTSTTVWGQQPPQGEQQGQFFPASELPPNEQIPASRLLIGAYAFVLAALFLYVVSVGNRLSSVQREVERLEADLKRTRA